MTADAVEGRPFITPELRATQFYFTQFMTAGAANVYAGIWFTGKGLSPGEIGIVNAMPVLIMLVFNILVGRIADRAPDWRQVIVAGALLGGVIPIGLFFVSGFWGILAVWTLAALPVAAIGPVADAATVRMTRRRGTQYGPIRAWGTIGYMAVIFLTGLVITWIGPVAFLPFFIAVALLRSAASLLLPRFRTPSGDTHPSAIIGATHLREVMRPWFVLPLFGWAMVFGTHLILNAFQGLLWKEQGLDEGTIAVLIALGALAEASMMFAFGRLARHFSARTLILVSSLAAAFRWAAMGLQPDVAWLVPLQLLQALTFAMGFMGCVNFIANWTSDEIAAEAQGFFQMLQQGMGVVALVGFGWLTGMIGAQAYFVAGVFALLGAALVWVSMLMMQPRSAADEPAPESPVPPT